MADIDNDATLKIERRIDDYILNRELGRGGFGVVWEAVEISTGLPRAVKEIHVAETDTGKLRQQAEYPSRIALQSNHVMAVLRSFSHEGRFYMVTDWIANGDLRQFLDRSQTPLPLKQALELALGIARGLAAIHDAGVVHLDLKPANVLMDKKDGEWVPRITDFGLAHSLATVSPDVLGSINYAAPEQMEGEEASPESDLFAFGMILYELLTGKKFSNATDRRVYRDWLKSHPVPPPPSLARPGTALGKNLDELAVRLLSHDRAERKSIRADRIVRVLKITLSDLEERPVSRTHATSMEFAAVPAGKFRMGASPKDGECYKNELPVQEIEFRKGFEIGKYPVTQEEWRSVMQTDPSRFRGERRPVERVSWNDAREFLNRSNEKRDGYYYRLPTEAEWEYAARSGTTGPRYGALENVAWYAGNSGRVSLNADDIWRTDKGSYGKRLNANGNQTHPVGFKYANAWGIHDMLGNVWEWCSSVYSPDLRATIERESRMPEGGWDNSIRYVTRGGSWNDLAQVARASSRRGDTSQTRSSSLGFRCLREIR